MPFLLRLPLLLFLSFSHDKPIWSRRFFLSSSSSSSSSQSSSSVFHDGSSRTHARFLFSFLIERLEGQIDDNNEMKESRRFSYQTDCLHIFEIDIHIRSTYLPTEKSLFDQWNNHVNVDTFLVVDLSYLNMRLLSNAWMSDEEWELIELLFSFFLFSYRVHEEERYMQIISWHQLFDKTIIRRDDSRTVINEAIWWHSSVFFQKKKKNSWRVDFLSRHSHYRIIDQTIAFLCSLLQFERRTSWHLANWIFHLTNDCVMSHPPIDHCACALFFI